MSSLLRGTKKIFIGLGVAGAGVAAAALFGSGLSDDSKSGKGTVFADTGTVHQNQLNQFGLNTLYKSAPWDNNWDRRHHQFAPEDKEKKKKKDKTAGDEKEEKIERPIPSAVRHILMIRHGQYNLKGKVDTEKFLTELGREQAKFAGIRLKELNKPYTRLIQSTMTRATETGQIITEQIKQTMPDLKVESCDWLREGAPIEPNPPHSWGPEAQDGSRIEAAFRKYFHRASPDQKEDSYEILVCHANVIRYFTCRALQIPADAWLRFSLHNCSITWLRIGPSGRVSVYSIGDIGHVPPSKMTTT